MNTDTNMNSLTLYFTLNGQAKAYAIKKFPHPKEIRLNYELPKGKFKRFFKVLKAAKQAGLDSVSIPTINLEEYDTINFVAPIYNKKIALPIKEYLDYNADALIGKEINIFAISGSGTSDKYVNDKLNIVNYKDIKAGSF